MLERIIKIAVTLLLFHAIDFTVSYFNLDKYNKTFFKIGGFKVNAAFLSSCFIVDIFYHLYRNS